MIERRRERRLRYNWPVWFADTFNEFLCQGQMIDISSGGAAFSCYADRCPEPGDKITTRFSVPHYDAENPDSFDLANFVREANICRVDEISAFVRRVAVQFGDPLPFKPGEVTDSEALLVDEAMSGPIGSSTSDNQAESIIG